MYVVGKVQCMLRCLRLRYFFFDDNTNNLCSSLDKHRFFLEQMNFQAQIVVMRSIYLHEKVLLGDPADKISMALAMNPLDIQEGPFECLLTLKRQGVLALCVCSQGPENGQGWLLKVSVNQAREFGHTLECTEAAEVALPDADERPATSL